MDFPTPTPIPFESTPLPTLEMNVSQDIASNAVQWWNLVPDEFGMLLQATIILSILFLGVVVIGAALERME